MTAREIQNDLYISAVRTLASGILNNDDEGQSIIPQWNSFFGGASQLLTTDFVGENEGLVKADIENVKGVLDSFHTWLATDQNRVILQKVRRIS